MTILEDSALWPDFEEATGNVYLPSFRKLNFRTKVITPKHVAKFPRCESDFYLSRLRQEHDVTNEVCQAGLSVPKPEGLFRIPMLPFGESSPAFVMQYVQGNTMMDLSTWKKLSAEIRDKLHAEVEKAQKLGFSTVDALHLGNAIYNPEENKVYLIDLELWVRK